MKDKRRVRPQLAQVAKAAGVSLSTASACLRDIPGPSDETRARVKAAAQQLGYRTNLQAKALRAGQQQTVALVFDPLILDPHPRSPRVFWQNFVNAILQTLAQADVSLLVVPAASIDSLQGAAIDAVILSALPDDSAASERVGFGIPVVATGIPRAGVTASCFATHDIEAVHREALELLRSAGSRRPALVRNIGVEHVFREIEVYGAWCDENSVEPLTLDLDQFWKADEAIACVVDAIAAGADSFLIRNGDTQVVLAAIEEAGKSVPGDVQVLAEAEGTIEALTNPSVTTISLRGRESGQLVAKEVLHQMAEPKAVNTSCPRSLQLPHQLTVRESTRSEASCSQRVDSVRIN